MNASTAQSVVRSTPAVELPVFGRFVWKEYRQLRAFWLALAGLAVGVQLALPAFAPHPDLAVAWLFGVAWGAAALYLFGAAATLFATEHEEGTYDFIAGLPASWAPVFWGKIACAVVSTVGLIGVLLISGYIFSGRLFGYFSGGWQWPPSDPRYGVLIVLAPALLEGLAWGTFFSLAIRRPLLAAVLAIATASGSVCWLNGVFGDNAALGLVFIESYQASFVPRMVLATTIFLVDVWLATGWLTADHSAIGALGGRLRLARSAAAPGASQLVDEYREAAAAGPGRISQLGPLIWQTWRESRSAMAVLVALAIPPAMLWINTPFFDDPHTLFALQLRESWFALPLMIPAALAGACVFSADQRRRRYQFLAERAARPDCVWLARHAVWLSLGSALAAVVVAISLVGLARIVLSTISLVDQDWETSFGVVLRKRDVLPSMFQRVARLYGAFFFATLSGYAAGQLTSMLLRSGILAGFLAVVLSIVMALWIVILTAWELGGLVFVGPIIIGMFVATWLETPDWLLDRTTLWSYFKPLAAVVIPITAVVALVPSARLSQVPDRLDHVSVRSAIGSSGRRLLSESLAEWRAGDTPAARETANLYLRLCHQMVSYASLPEVAPQKALREEKRLTAEGQYLDANHDVVEPAIEVSKRPQCRFPLFHAGSREPARIRDLIWLVEGWGNRHLQSGDLDASMECFLAALRMISHVTSAATPWQWTSFHSYHHHNVLDQFGQWAAHKDQTAARLKDAMARLDEVYAAEPDPRSSVIVNHMLLREVIEGRQMPRSLQGNLMRRVASAGDLRPVGRYAAYLANRLPWERERALRALDVSTAIDLTSVHILSAYLAGRLPDKGPEFLRQHLRAAQRADCQRQLWWDGPALPPFQNWLRTSYLLTNEYDYRGGIGRAEVQFVRWVARWRGLRLQLALVAYRLDQADYPTSLEDLVPEYLDRLPDDPYSAGTFQYEAAGFDGVLGVGNSFDRSEESWLQIPAHEPVVWSPGLYDRSVQKVDPSAEDKPPTSVDRPDEARTADGARGKATYSLQGSRHGGALVFPLPPRGAAARP